MNKERTFEAPVYQGHEKEMYNEIDNFLGMSAKYSPAGARKIRICGLLGGLAAALVLYVGSDKVRADDKFGFTVTMLLLAACGLSFFFFYGRKPFPMMEEFKKIVAEDGVQRIYTDMKISRHIKGSGFSVGDEYVFNNSLGLFRMRDVKNVYIAEYPGRGGKEYHAAFEMSDGRKIPMKRLMGLRDEKRIQEFMGIKSMFRV
ncbi:MAG: hypothetical protein IJ806_03755 [Ruminococcus sp.]|nr:hypothetical protein [Ruminococcus sp.]